MILPSNRERIVVRTAPEYFRKDHDGMAAMVKCAGGKLCHRHGLRVLDRVADRLKLNFWNCIGFVMNYERLGKQNFCWPQVRDHTMRLEHKSRRRSPTERLIWPVRVALLR